MQDETRTQLRKLLSALKALHTSAERAHHMGTYNKGAVAMMARTYTSLQGRLAQLMPDDFFVVETLKLDIPVDATDEETLTLVELAVSQLYVYLKDQVREEGWVNPEDWRELRGMGRELSEQILTTTRSALRRALSNIDAEIGVPPVPPVPPAPPVPPTPPSAKGRVRVEISRDEQGDFETGRDDDPKIV